MPAVPFCHLTFSADRPRYQHFERRDVASGTLGAQLRARRHVLRLEQQETAGQLGVSTATYRNWEMNRRAPDLRHTPAAITFLGYDWRETKGTLGEQIRAARIGKGLSLIELATILNIDPSTLRRWEMSVGAPSAALRPVIQEWLDREH